MADDAPDPRDVYLPRVTPNPALSSGAAAALATPPAADRGSIADEMLKEMQASSKREQDIYAAQEKEMAPQRQAMTRALERSANVSEQQTERLIRNQQQIPKYQQPDLRQDAFAWMSLAAAFGSIAGAFSRYHTTTALNAFSGMMNGVAKGQLQVVEDNYRTWQANADRAIQYNAQAQREYTAIMQNQKFGLDQRAALMKMTADKYQDQLMSVAAQQQNLTHMAQLMDTQARFDENLRLRKEAIERHKYEFDTRMQQRTEQIYGTSGDVESAKQQIVHLQSPFPSPAMQARYPYLRKAAEAVTKENPSFNTADYYANQQVKKLAATSDISAMRQALTKMTGLQTSISSFEPIAKYNGDILLRLVDKVDATGNTTMERWIRAGRRATGDPDVAQFDQALTAYSNEVARILNNPSLAGTLTVSAQQEVKEWVPQNITASQIKRIVPSLNAEMDYRGQVVNAQKEYLEGAIQNLASGGPRPAPFTPPSPQAPPPIAPSVEDIYIEQ